MKQSGVSQTLRVWVSFGPHDIHSTQHIYGKYLLCARHSAMQRG